MHIEAALQYARRGWRVFPIYEIRPDGTCACDGQKDCSPGKHPRTVNGLHAATTSEAAIRAWWGKHWPKANIGIATGQGLFVIDCDPHRGGEEKDLPAIPLTARVSTGGGGFHAYLTTDVELRNTSGMLAPGIDTRGEGGYVVAPPSNHISGRDYAWDVDFHIDEVPLAPVPSWVIEQMSPRPVQHPSADPVPVDDQVAGSIGARILDWSVRLVKRNSRGRNEAGLSLACQLRDNGLTIDQARVIMASYQQKVVGLGDHPYDGDEAEHSLRQAYRRPAREPWQKADEVHIGGGKPGPQGLPKRPFFRNTDMGNAERFIFENGDVVRFVYQWNSWLIWDGSRWCEDKDGEVIRMAKATVRRIWLDEIPNLTDDDAKKEAGKHASRSEASGRLDGMLKLSQSERPAPLLPENLNRDLFLLNVANGAIDLRTGELLPHDPLLYCTRIVPAAYKPQATCPTWIAFLNRIFHGDQELIRYMQRAIGYSLTGSTEEQCMFILHGNGANGKSTFLETVKYLLDEYALSVDPKTFQEQQDGIRSDLARLRGARLIVASESESGARLSESLIKAVTGGEKIVARKLYQELNEFVPEFKLWFATNHKPQIKNANHGIHRRVRFIPFSVTIPPEERDKGLRNKLLNELPGILAWAVAGCVAWRSLGGLQEPKIVLDATKDYTTEMDRLAIFLDECCEIGAQLSIKLSELTLRYQQWCEVSFEQPMTTKSFSLALQERGIRVVFPRDHSPRRVFGVTLRSREQDASPTGPTGPTDFPIVTQIAEKSNIGVSQGFPTGPTGSTLLSAREGKSNSGVNQEIWGTIGTPVGPVGTRRNGAFDEHCSGDDHCPHPFFFARDGAQLCTKCGERIPDA